MEIESRLLPNILITGTPGVGKTTISQLLCSYVPELRYYNLGELINSQKLYKSWNEKFDIPEFDEDMVLDYLEVEIAKGGCVIDFHTSDFFPERFFQLVVLLRANNTVLFDRLSERGYSQQKIDENIECEILEVVSEEVYSSYQKEIILEIPNENQEDVQKNLELIFQRIKSLQ